MVNQLNLLSTGGGNFHKMNTQPLETGIFIRKLSDLYSDLVLKTFEFLDDSSNFHQILKKVTLLRCIFP